MYRRNSRSSSYDEEAIKPEYPAIQQVNLKYFENSENQIKYIGQEGKWTQYIFNEDIPAFQQFVFKIKIVKGAKEGNNFCFGVLDYPTRKNQRSSFDKNDVITYHANGRKLPSQCIQGTGFKEGDIVEIDVNRRRNKVIWKVNGVQKAETLHQLLSDQNRIFMPFIQMKHAGDTVELVGK